MTAVGEHNIIIIIIIIIIIHFLQKIKRHVERRYTSSNSGVKDNQTD